MTTTNIFTHVRTLGALKATGYQPKSIKDELRQNLLDKIRRRENVFPGIYGFDDTVLPDLERAVLSRHNILLLGLRGQAKTRLARLLVHLLDEYIPIVAGSELNDDPLAPISRYARDLIAERGDETPIEWLHRDERYVEKLATPDVSIADLVGDVDPIKAANLRLPYSDERVIHFGLIPRSHRGIFVINELPDLQPRIQVALFNILQEGDVQIRGFQLRLPLDIQFVFTANPEDYTNRGAIITPLKDRIQSQILTHYPERIETGMRITAQEARVLPEQATRVRVPDLLRVLVERIAVEARASEYIDPKSGVSARLTISALESLIGAAERRALRNGEERTVARIADLWAVTPAINGKIELVYEGEQEGADSVARILIAAAIRNVFKELFPDAVKARRAAEQAGKKPQGRDDYSALLDWFDNDQLDLLADSPDKHHLKALAAVPGLREQVLAKHGYLQPDEVPLWMEFMLHGLAEHSRIGRSQLARGHRFGDVLGALLGGGEEAP